MIFRDILIVYRIMTEWKTYKLGDIAKFQTGKLNSNAAVENGKYPFFTCSPNTLAIDNYAFDKEAILLAGNNAEGNFSIKYYKGKFNAYQRTYIIETYNDICDIKFLFYALKLCLQQFKLMSQGTSTKFLTAVILNNFEISLPGLEEQRRIAGILGAIDDKIENNRRINDNLEQQAQTLFDEWFVNDSTQPAEYNRASLTDIANYLNGLAMQRFRPQSDEKAIPVLKIKELGQGMCDSSSDICSQSIDSKYIVNDGDIIFSWSGTLLVDIWCGGICGLNQHLFKVTSDKYPKWFVYYWTKYHLAKFIRIAKDKAVTMGHIKRGDLETSEVLIPNAEILSKMDNIIAPIFDAIISRRVENKTLATLRDTLLPKLMNGEIKL